MIQGWVKSCFTRSVVDPKISPPVIHDSDVLWPALWFLGKLVRHTYVGSSEHLRSFSATECTDYTEGTQRISGCTKVQHYRLTLGVGRGALEVHIFDIQLGGEKYNTGSFLESPVDQQFMSDLYQVGPVITYN